MNLFEFVKSKVPILDVVSEYVTLKPAGKYWKGPSPFKHERVPSFTVSPHKEIYYCFSSGQGGDVISFIATIENCTQLEAVHYLVDRYKLQVPATVEWSKTAGDITKKATYETTCDFFAQWCHEQLKKHKQAQQYLDQRSMLPAIQDLFMVGYCPIGEEQLKQLIAQAHKKNILLNDFLDAQLLIQGRQGLFCPFEDRVIFPIYNHLGACCGFGGRVFKEQDTRAKYYNSHDHPYFNKSTVLFGLNRAKKSIQQQGHAFLVEGYVDCIAMTQAGYINTVATLGTACTLDHLKQLARYAHKLYVVYDGDEAGQKAMLRLAELCWQVNLELFIIKLPPNQDPASFLTTGKDLKPLIEAAPTIFGFLIEHLGHGFFKKSLQERLDGINHLLETIAQLTDPLQKDLLLHQVANTIDTPIETLKKQLMRKKKTPLEHQDEAMEKSDPLLAVSSLEKKLFSVILNNEVPLEPFEATFLLEYMSPSLTLLLNNYHAHAYRFKPFFDALTPAEQHMISTITMEYGQDACPETFKKLFKEFQKQQWKQIVHSMKQKLMLHENSTPERQADILAEFHALKKNIMGKGI